MNNNNFDLDVVFVKQMMVVYQDEMGADKLAELIYSTIEEPEQLTRTICDMFGCIIPKEKIMKDFNKLKDLPSDQIKNIFLEVSNTYLKMGYLGYLFTFQPVINAKWKK